MSPNFPTFTPQGRQAFTSDDREEVIKRLWRFMRGIETSGIKWTGAVGDNGGMLIVSGSGGAVEVSNSHTVDLTFGGAITVNGTDFAVQADLVTILSRGSVDSPSFLIGLDTLAGRPVFVGEDVPAVAASRLGKVNATAQTANIASTALSNTPHTGVYEVEVYLMCTTADAAAGTLAVTVGWTDAVGATSSTPITGFALTATGRTTGRQIVNVASGDITYAVTITGGYGTSAYAIAVRVVSLG